MTGTKRRARWTTARRAMGAGLLVATAAACGSDSTGPKATLAGTWDGTLQGNAIHLVMTSSSGSVTGNGTISSSTQSATLAVGGTVAEAGSFTISLTPSGYDPVVYSGTVTGATMTGTANGSGFSNASLTLTRK